MSDTLQRVVALVRRGEVRISDHGYDELVQEELSAREVITGIESAALVEDYPDYAKGPCVLVLQRDREGRPVHVVWGIPSGKPSPAVLVTAYRPDPTRWTTDFMRRKQ